MLVHLYIENLMLIEKTQASLDSPFIAITGESGSGKSSLIEALRLALGAKSTSEIIRRGETSGSVRATFDLSALDPFTRARLKNLFDEASVPFDDEEPLILQRLLFSTKPGKASCCGMPVSTAILARIGQELVELIDPGASMTLEGLDAHLECLDAFSGLEELRELAQKQYLEHQSDHKELLRLEELLKSSEQQKSLLEYQIEEIENANLEPDEEERLNDEYRRISQSKQIIESLSQIQVELASPSFNKLAKHLSFLERHSENWQESQDLLLCLQGCLVQGNEAHDLARRLSESLTDSPHQLETISKRLDHIHLMKKKYGQTLEKIQAHLMTAKQRLEEILQAQDKHDALHSSCQSQAQALLQTSVELSAKRKEGASLLSKRVVEVLKELNMPHAEFNIRLETKEPGPTGMDSVEFFLSPNAGVTPLSVRRYASGGEMARLFLALKTLKAHKRIPPTLIFDEIDASIGGQSAARLAEKFLDLSSSRQVLCITHFSQVAEKAKRHLVMEKVVQEGKTQSQVRLLQSAKERKQELQRMLGKSPASD